MNSFFLSMITALFYWGLLLILLSFGLEKSDVSASASAFNRASKTGFKNRLEVVHRLGQYAKIDAKIPFANILNNDQQRAKYIQARMVDSINTNKETNKFISDKRAKIPAGSGQPLYNGDYIVTIGLGSPEQKQTLIFDTGSELTWTQCKPCKKCHGQKDPIFNPHNSITYSNISCDSKYCPPDTFGCYNHMCEYGIGYGDNSYTKGFISKENLTITPTDVFPNFLFGCGHNNSGLYGKTDGILGLAKDPISFVYQTAQKYGRYFSYCLPRNINSKGFLTFGKSNKKATKMISTPFAESPTGSLPIYYFIEITSISVGTTRLPIRGSIFKTSSAIIDSGTAVTRLPPAAYYAMSKEFKIQMNKYNYKRAPAYSILDTCFLIMRGNMTKIPKVSFTFNGNATVNLDDSGVLVQVSSNYVCLAFVGNSDPTDLAIFGNIQQSAFEVVYDVPGNKLGFIRNPNCK